MLSEGSSPLTRGKLPSRRNDASQDGLIPAHAGKTETPSTVARLSRAHPRSRGENADIDRLPLDGDGSSPLTRGKRLKALAVDCRAGLIPAHAGKTEPAAARTSSTEAHPRSRGENL